MVGNSTTSKDLCAGDGDGYQVTSTRDPKALVKVCGRKKDLIRYWYDGNCLIYDPIRDGTGLGQEDIKFPLGSNPSILPIPPFSVRHGHDRDLVRIYTPPKNGKPHHIYAFRPPEFHHVSKINITWLAFNRVQVINHFFVYDPETNRFVKE